MKRTIVGLALLLLLAGPVPALAQGGPDATPQEPAPLFADDSVLEFTLATDLRLLKRERGQVSNDRPAELTWASGGDPIALQVRTRGNFRLRRSTCRDMPPIRLNFKTGDMDGTVFEGQDKVKLVTHCRNNERYEQNTLQEYVVYQLYQLLTERSFQVRLARITYVDTSGGDDDVTRYAFLIEDEDALAARLGGVMLEPPSVHPLDYELHPMLMLSFFQHMIGNTDWSALQFHNVKLFRDAESRHFGIPYDFDWSGFVNAPYAEPNETLGIRNVRQRIFRGICLDGLDYDRAVAEMQEIRASAFAVIEGMEGLRDDDRKEIREYLEGYYEILDSPDRVQRRIVNACRRL